MSNPSINLINQMNNLSVKIQESLSTRFIKITGDSTTHDVTNELLAVTAKAYPNVPKSKFKPVYPFHGRDEMAVCEKGGDRVYTLLDLDTGIVTVYN